MPSVPELTNQLAKRRSDSHSVREMKSTISAAVTISLVVAVVALGSAHAQFRPRKRGKEDAYADVNVEEVCEDR